jgi:hypothetical protein
MLEVEGVVARCNQRGLLLEGEDEWRNFSKPEFRSAPWDEPSVGARVKLQVTDSGYIRSIALLDTPVRVDASGRERSIEAQVALKAAVDLMLPLAAAVASRAQSDERPKVREMYNALADAVAAQAVRFARLLRGETDNEERET